MKGFLALLFLFSLFGSQPSLFASSFGDPTPLIDNKVNPLTGDLLLSSVDLTVEAAEPLSLTRFYGSSGAGHYKGGWNFFPHTSLTAYIPPGKHKERVFVSDRSGGSLIFKHEETKEKIAHYKIVMWENAFDHTNTSRGRIGGNTNDRNYRVYRSTEHKDSPFVLITADGTKREYYPKQGLDYLLQKEFLPNGNRIYYSYNKDGDLTRIATLDPSGKREYAWLSFEYEKEKNMPIRIVVRTSDEREVTYHFKRKRDKRRDYACITYLERIEGDIPSQEFEYAKEFKKEVRRVSLFLNASEKGEATFESGCVRNLKKEFEGESIMTHSFEYFPRTKEAERKTIAIALTGIKKEFVYDENLRLKTISVSNREDPLCEERFVWSSEKRNEGDLIDKQLFLKGKAICGRNYRYDSKFNPAIERFFAFIASPRYPTARVTKRTFLNNQFLHLALEKEPDGVFNSWNYLKGTNLPAHHYNGFNDQTKKRTFTKYNEFNLPSAITSDDGCGKEYTDLTGVTERHITRISYTNSFPYGLPETIQTGYVDLKTGEWKQLKTEKLFYKKWARPIREETYDSEGNFAFAKSWVYDRKGRLSEETDPLGRKTLYKYNMRGDVAILTDPSGLFTTYFVYDTSHRLLEKRVETCDGQKRTTIYRYAADGTLHSTKDHLGRETQFLHDSFGRCIATVFPEVSSINGVYRPSEEKEYDLFGHETRVSAPDRSIAQILPNFFGKPFLIQQDDGTKEEFRYHPNGELSSHILASGAKEECDYDWNHRPTKKRLFSSDGTLFQEEQFRYSTLHLKSQIDSLGQETFYTYDRAGRLVQESCGDRIVSYAYDTLGRLLKKTAGDTAQVTLYDLLGRTIEERSEDLEGNVLLKVQYSYNSLGLKSEEKRETKEGTSSRQWRYDPFGRVVEELDPLGNSTRIFYALYTNQHKQICQEITSCDPEGNLTIQRFDTLERVSSTEKRTPSALTISKETYGYDNRGNLVSTETSVFQDGSFQEKYRLTLTYDTHNRLISRTEGAGHQSARTHTYSYDKLGRLHKKTLPSGVELVHTYDCFDNLKELISSDATIHYRNTYDANGQLISVEDRITGAISSRSYSPFGELIADTLATGFTLKNRYDTCGRRKEFLLPDETSITYTHKGPFLHSITRGNFTHTYDAYDEAGNLLQETHIDSSITLYQIDKTGKRIGQSSPHRINQIDSLSKTGNPLQEGNITYTYDHLGQLTSDTFHTYAYNSRYCRTSQDGHLFTTTHHGEILETPTATYTYDKNGNCTSKNQWRYTYDALGRMIKASSPTETITYTYDPWNRRLSKQKGSETLYFLYDDMREIGSIKDGKIIELRLLGHGFGAEIGASIAIELAGITYLPLHDLRGNITHLINPSGATSQEVIFTPFGENTGELLSPWAFSSKRFDSETELYFFGNRYYDPSIGSWLTPDPLETAYPYAFACNNPLLFVDLYGLEAMFEIPEKFNLPDFSSSLWSSFRSFATPNPVSFTPWARYDWHTAIPFDPNLMHSIAATGYDCSFLYEKGSWEHPRISLFLFNGIMTGPEETLMRPEETSITLGGMMVRGFYSATTGILGDGFEFSWLRLGGNSRVHDIILHGILAELNRIGPTGTMYCFAHSKGGLELNSVLKKLSAAQKKQIVIHTFGSAYFFQQAGYQKALNYVSSTDLVSALANGLIPTKKWLAKHNVTLLPSRSGAFEHGWNSKAYSEQFQKNLDTVRAHINRENQCVIYK